MIPGICFCCSRALPNIPQVARQESEWLVLEGSVGESCTDVLDELLVVFSPGAELLRLLNFLYGHVCRRVDGKLVLALEILQLFLEAEQPGLPALQTPSDICGTEGKDGS